MEYSSQSSLPYLRDLSIRLDIITTLGFGSKDLSGHADFFPNGGEDQPDCKNGIVTNVKLENDLYEGQSPHPPHSPSSLTLLTHPPHSPSSFMARILHAFLLSGLKRFVACDHDRAVQYFIQSVNNCPFNSISCGNYKWVAISYNSV